MFLYNKWFHWILILSEFSDYTEREPVDFEWIHWFSEEGLVNCILHIVKDIGMKWSFPLICPSSIPSSIRVVKYLFKYVYKGYDRATIEISR